ncbi:hypothetical protein BH11BAC3_BH11BAC3_33070 [soil metagenome]
MENLKAFINSGILEAYVLGDSSPEETDLVSEMAVRYTAIKDEIEAIYDAMQLYALAHAVVPDLTIKPFLLASIDYSERLKNGEAPSFPPDLHDKITKADFAEWLNRPDMVLPENFKDVYAKIIGYTPQVTTAIVWLKDVAPQEVHHDEHEKFFVLEGTCELTINNEVFQLNPGDYLAIPLHVSHSVRVTSIVPCKVILQRAAA